MRRAWSSPGACERFHPFGRAGSPARPTLDRSPDPYRSAVTEGGEGVMRKRIAAMGTVAITIVAGLLGFGTSSAATGRAHGSVFLATEPYDQSSETDIDLGDRKSTRLNSSQ